MEKRKESFIFYLSFYEAFKELREREAYLVFKTMCEYCFYGTEPELTGMAKAVFALIKPQLDANNKRYENGLKGGRPKKPLQTAGFHNGETAGCLAPKPNKKEKENDKENDNVSFPGREFSRLENLLLQYEGK